MMKYQIRTNKAMQLRFETDTGKLLWFTTPGNTQTAQCVLGSALVLASKGMWLHPWHSWKLHSWKCPIVTRRFPIGISHYFLTEATQH